jgi:hypothetical protein
MTSQEINKRFANLAGICWHEIVFDPLGKAEFPYCKHCKKEDIPWHWDYSDGHCERIADRNPDFCGDPRLVLREMMKREDWLKFMYYMHNQVLEKHDGYDPLAYYTNDYLLDTTGLLALVGIEWMEGKEKPC